MTEAQIQHEVVMYLQKENIFCHSVPNELAGANAGARMSQFVATGLRKGVADLIVWWPDGKLGYVEMKTPTGSQSKVQKTFEQRCREYGVRYDLARSVEDVARLVGKYSWTKNVQVT